MLRPFALTLLALMGPWPSRSRHTNSISIWTACKRNYQHTQLILHRWSAQAPPVGALLRRRRRCGGKAIEHWDTLQLVGDPKNSAPLIAPSIPRANPNGMF